tara:strand:+ start:197 stop:472 length:276 start_codon:yes stop_codon:yes gene_type:complete
MNKKRNTETIYSIINHVSKSGMTRHISFFKIIDNEPEYINHEINNLLDYKFNKNYNSLVVGGCGMDMAFHVVYQYGKVKHDNGYHYKSRIL